LTKQRRDSRNALKMEDFGEGGDEDMQNDYGMNEDQDDNLLEE